MPRQTLPALVSLESLMTHELIAWIEVGYPLPFVRSLAILSMCGSLLLERSTVLYLMYIGPAATEQVSQQASK